MNQISNISLGTIVAPIDEQILVVKREVLLPDGGWQGLRHVDFIQYAQLISSNQEFLPRSQMETDPRYKQIIPYLIFQFEDRYFLMQRQSKASETRLQNKFTLGIGGHIRQEDMGAGTSIADWARREFHEEVSYDGSLDITPIGILNDDSNDVGKVHIGFVLLLKGNTDQISVKSELKSGRLVSLDECKIYGDSMETWSMTIINYLLQR